MKSLLILSVFILFSVSLNAQSKNDFVAKQHQKGIDLADIHQLQYHVVVLDDCEVKFVDEVTLYLLSDEKAAYATDFTKDGFIDMVSIKVAKSPLIEDGLESSEYYTKDRQVIVYRQDGQIDYLVYNGIKGKYYAFADRNAALDVYDNLKKKQSSYKNTRF